MLPALLMGALALAPLCAAEVPPPASADALEELRDEAWKAVERLDALVAALRAVTEAYPGGDPAAQAAEHARLQAEFQATLVRVSDMRKEHRRRLRALQGAAFTKVTRTRTAKHTDPAVERLYRHEAEVNRLRSRKEDADKRYNDDAAVFSARRARYEEGRALRRYLAWGAAGLAGTVLGAFLIIRFSGRRRG